MKFIVPGRQLTIGNVSVIADAHAEHFIPFQQQVFIGRDARRGFFCIMPFRMIQRRIVNDSQGFFLRVLPNLDNFGHAGSRAIALPSDGNFISIAQGLIHRRFKQYFRFLLVRGEFGHDQVVDHIDSDR